MADILFIKTSSLGDVIHHMPAVTDARVHRPDARITWVVEKPFAPLVRLHPGVDEVIPVNGRSWRAARYAPSVWREMRTFFSTLRANRYDAVIDTQGLLLKSAPIARAARGPRHGYDASSIKERLASCAYDFRHAVSRDQHAIARNRSLTGLALGYEPKGAPDYGLQRAALAGASVPPYAIFLHATANSAKEWPEPHWRALAETWSRDMDVVLPFGNERERARSERIASGQARVRVPERQELDGVARLIAGASFVVGVDTGLLHLAAALDVPLVAIFLGSEPRLTRPIGSGPIATLGDKGAPPSLQDVEDAIRRVRS